MGTHSGHWHHFYRHRSIPAWTLQSLAPCVRCTDCCSWSPHRFIWQLKASPEQPALSQEGSLHLGCPGRAPALRALCNQRHLCPDASLSLQTPASLQALEEPPYQPICSVRHFCTLEKYLFLRVWEARMLQGARTMPIQPPLPRCLHSTGSLGVGWDWIDKHWEEVIISVAQWAQ